MIVLDKLKQTQKKLQRYIELREELRQLEADSELRPLLEDEQPVSGNTIEALAGPSQRKTLLNLVSAMGEKSYGRKIVWGLALKEVPRFIGETGWTESKLARGLDNLQRDKIIARTKKGVPGKQGRPPTYGNPPKWKEGQLDKETK